MRLHSHSSRERPMRMCAATARSNAAGVINGIVHVLGSDKAAIEQAIEEKRGTAVPVPMTIADGKVTSASSGRQRTRQRRNLALSDHRSKPVSIERGENNGHTLTYYNVVRRWVKLGDWNGQAETFRIPVTEPRRYRLFAQDVDHSRSFVAKWRCDQARLNSWRRDGRVALIFLPAPHTQKNRAGVKTGLKGLRGLNRTLNSTGPARLSPGGWGAELSGARTGPGLEATMLLWPPSVTGDCPKLALLWLF